MDDSSPLPRSRGRRAQHGTGHRRDPTSRFAPLGGGEPVGRQSGMRTLPWPIRRISRFVRYDDAESVTLTINDLSVIGCVVALHLCRAA